MEMDKNRRDLESIIKSQKEQLTRYETRLKDVVTAYKGLLKEKEALEASLAALTNSKEKSTTDNKNTSPSKSSVVVATASQLNNDGKQNSSVPKPSSSSSPDNNLQLQIATLMNSLATLSAEKSRMEASFQADKKQLRNDIAQKDKTIKELQDRIKEIQKQNALDLENHKSKIIVERHEREKESNNHMLMIRELQKLYSDERHIKENLEMQLNDLKNQFSPISNSDTKVKELMNELKEAKEKLKQLDNMKEHQSLPQQGNSTILLQLQNEMQHLKQQHAIALKTEQKRALMAEERNKKLAALHEDRVANLEARLAELSSTVGTYDRLRQQDQENIQKLKEKIISLASSNNIEQENEENSTMRRGGDTKQKDVETIVEEIMQLKKCLLIENARSNNPVDINKIFNASIDHSQCIEDFNKIQNEYETLKLENTDLREALEVQKNHIKTLQEKVKVLNRNIDEQELELKSQSEKLSYAVKTEKSKWKDAMDRLENEYRAKLNNLEVQLQKQRVRSLQLLDEKENEIKALKTSFEMFSSGVAAVPSLSVHQPVQASQVNEQGKAETASESKKQSMSSHLGTILNTSTPSSNSVASAAMAEHSPMLHYVNELARKDVEISALRKAKYTAETTLRLALQDKVAAQEELSDKILRLEEQVDRLERCKTREGANLEYLKNVIISFLSTSNIESKHHMVNAIGAVLQFTPSEMKLINNLYPKK